MLLIFFFSLLSFCYRAYWSVNSWGACFTWSHPRPAAFQFNQEPSWLLRYRHIAFSRFVSLRWITHESKTSSGLKDPRHHPQHIGAGHAFLSFIPSTWNSENSCHMLYNILFKFQSDPYCNLSVRKSDGHIKYRLGSLIQKFIRYYLSW